MNQNNADIPYQRKQITLRTTDGPQDIINNQKFWNLNCVLSKTKFHKANRIAQNKTSCKMVKVQPFTYINSHAKPFV
jgi:hypothetical protein